MRLALASPSIIHTIGLYLHLTPEAAGDAEEVAARIDETDARDLLSTTLPGCPARLYRALDRAGEQVQDASFYHRLAAVIDTPAGEPFLKKGKVSAHRLCFHEGLQAADPALLAWHDTLGEDWSRLEAADTLVKYARVHGTLHLGDLDRPPGARFRALLARLWRLLDRVAAPDLGVELPGPWRHLATVGELRRQGRRLGNCVGGTGHGFDGGRYWRALADGQQLFFVHEEVPLLAVVNREGPGLWSIGDVRGPSNKAVDPKLEEAFEAALKVADMRLVECSIETAIFRVAHAAARARRPEGEVDDTLDAMVEAEVD